METASSEDVPDWQIYLIAVAGGVILIALWLVGVSGWGQLYAVTVVATGLVIRIFWQARHKVRFWTAVLGLAVTQLVLITVAYPAHSAFVPGNKILPLEMADFALFYAVAWLAQRQTE